MDIIQVIHRNDGISRFLGYTKEELLSIERNSVFTLIHPEDIPTLERVLNNLRSGVEHTNFIYRVLGKDGTYYYVRIIASLVEENGNHCIYNGVVSDVGEMIRIQKELQSTNYRLKVLLTTILGGIAVFEIVDTIKITE